MLDDRNDKVQNRASSLNIQIHLASNAYRKLEKENKIPLLCYIKLLLEYSTVEQLNS